MTFEERKAEEWLQGIEGDDCVIITDREERKQAYVAGYREALKMKVNITTISDAPLMEREQLEQAKEILKRFVKWFDYISESENWKPIVDDACKLLEELK